MSQPDGQRANPHEPGPDCLLLLACVQVTSESKQNIDSTVQIQTWETHISCLLGMLSLCEFSCTLACYLKENESLEAFTCTPGSAPPLS